MQGTEYFKPCRKVTICAVLFFYPSHKIYIICVVDSFCINNFDLNK